MTRVEITEVIYCGIVLYIGPWCRQFHQHFVRRFFLNFLSQTDFGKKHKIMVTGVSFQQNFSTIVAIRIIQLPDSVPRWQDGPHSHICFATFILQKITNLPITQQLLKLGENTYRFGILKIFEKF
jgi:hypothetical protein